MFYVEPQYGPLILLLLLLGAALVFPYLFFLSLSKKVRFVCSFASSSEQIEDSLNGGTVQITARFVPLKPVEIIEPPNYGEAEERNAVPVKNGLGEAVALITKGLFGRYAIEPREGWTFAGSSNQTGKKSLGRGIPVHLVNDSGDQIRVQRR